MIKKVLFTVFILTIFINCFSQIVGGTNDKLAKLYNQGKYESCLFKADNLTYKEESSSDPEPYLFISMCFYQLSLSQDEIVKEDYKDGLKQAIKYAGKFVRKDKDGEMYEDNYEFISKLKEEQKNDIKSELNNNNFRKAAVAAKLYNKLNRTEDVSVNYFIGICEVLSNNISQGTKSIEEAQSQLNELLKNANYKSDQKIKPIVIDGFLKYSEALVNEGNLKQALNILQFGMKLFPNDGYIKVQSNVIQKSLSGDSGTKTDSVK